MGISFIKYENFSDSILVRKFTDSVEVKDIIGSWEYLLEQNMLTDSVKGVVNDITDCELNMNMESFKTLIGYLKEHEIFKKIRLAVICDDPRKIVFPVFGGASEKELNIKPFTTMNAAVNWIMQS
jgi:hypothetical protein